MKVDLKDDTTMVIRPYDADDFHNIHDLNADEVWTNLVEKRENTKAAWDNSDIAYVATTDSGAFIGYIRGHTDTRVSLFVCELLVNQGYRELGIGKTLLQYVHDLYPDTRIEMLASSSSRTFYENLGYRAFNGFRKTYEE